MSAIYNRKLTSYGDLIPVEDFRRRVKSGSFIDYDGFGNPVKENAEGVKKMSDISIYPSQVDSIPTDATHIMWYNR